MSNLRQAAEMALKYFEDAYGLEDEEVAIKEALRQALAEPGERMKNEWERLEPMRTRIMSEAYDLADRGDSEGYNSVKVMCSDVLALIETEIATEREACAEVCDGISEHYETRTDLNQAQKQVGQLAAEVCGVRIRERGEK